MRLLVTGATGFIGYAVARRLAAAGIESRLMVSCPERGMLLTGLDAELVQGDLTRPVSLAPRYPTVYEGIPAAPDECVASRWQHQVFDRKSWWACGRAASRRRRSTPQVLPSETLDHCTEPIVHTQGYFGQLALQEKYSSEFDRGSPRG